MRMRLIDADESVGIGYLSDWYQNSVDDTKLPIWTDEHIEELTNDFIIIPKDAPPVVRARWEDEYGGAFENPRYRCSYCKGRALYRFEQDCLGGWHETQALTDYCPNCGARMDGDANELYLDINVESVL